MERPHRRHDSVSGTLVTVPRQARLNSPHSGANRCYPRGWDRNRNRYRYRPGVNLNRKVRRLIMSSNTDADSDPDSDPEIDDCARLTAKSCVTQGSPKRQ